MKENNSDERRKRDEKIEDKLDRGKMSYKRIDFSRSFLLHSNNCFI